MTAFACCVNNTRWIKKGKALESVVKSVICVIASTAVC